MPDRSKVRWSQLKVGIVCLAAFFILFVLVFLLTGTKGVFRRNVLLRTFLSDASGIPEGSPVRLNGISIGYLDQLKLTTERDPKRIVEFDIQVDSRYLPEIPVDSVAAVTAANVLGEKFINITKGQDPRHVEAGAELRSSPGQDINELMGQMGNTLQSFQTIVNRVDAMLAEVEAGKGNLGMFLKDDELYKRTNGIAEELQKLVTDVRNSDGTISRLIHDPALYEEVRAPLKRIDAILADIQSGQGTAGLLLRDRGLYDEVQKAVVELKGLMADLNAGKGTAGKLLKDDELHKRLNDLLAKFDGIMNKINSGQGSLGQLVVNPQLYESLNSATGEFQSLAKDMRANPKKFLTIQLKLF